jgi:hypothetical protein
VFEVRLKIHQQITKEKKMIVFHMFCGILESKASNYMWILYAATILIIQDIRSGFGIIFSDA